MRAAAQAVVAQQLRNDVLRRRKMLSARPSAKVQFGKDRGVVWRFRLLLLREHAMSMGQDAVGTIYTDAASLRCWGAVPGDWFIQGEWPQTEMREGATGKSYGFSKRPWSRGANTSREDWRWPKWATVLQSRMLIMARARYRALLVWRAV